MTLVINYNLLLRQSLHSHLKQSIGGYRLPLSSCRSVHSVQTPQGLEQRRRRPLSPHLTIYRPQLTSMMSIGHRVTGAGLAGLLYGFGIYYGLAQPGAITEAMVKAVGNSPAALLAMGKFTLALPFWYHLMNGVRHLVWDTGRALSLRATYISGWTVNVLSILAATLSASL